MAVAEREEARKGMEVKKLGKEQAGPAEEAGLVSEEEKRRKEEEHFLESSRRCWPSQKLRDMEELGRVTHEKELRMQAMKEAKEVSEWGAVPAR